VNTCSSTPNSTWSAPRCERCVEDLAALANLALVKTSPTCSFPAAPHSVEGRRERGYRVRRLDDGFPEWKTAGLPIGHNPENVGTLLAISRGRRQFVRPAPERSPWVTTG
jgi:hypothetical protein